MKIGSQIISCTYDNTTAASAITDAVLKANTEANGYAAVTIVPGGTTDNVTGTPVPKVKLAVASGELIYGALMTLNTATQRCGVATGGIIPFKRSGGASVPADIGVGIAGDTGGTVVAAGAGQGRGVTVARNGGVVLVDLDVNANETA